MFQNNNLSQQKDWERDLDEAIQEYWNVNTDYGDQTPSEQYLTVSDLSDLIRYSKQSIYNLIHRKVFVLNKHYFKPTPKKLLFKWTEIQRWIEKPPCSDQDKIANPSASPPKVSVGSREKSNINI